MSRDLRYQFTPDELPNGSFLDDSGDSWWAGTYQCGVALVLAAGLASNALAAQITQQTLRYDEQIPAGSLFGQPPEDYWNDPVAPQGLTFQAPAPWSFDQQENAAGLYGVPHEDYWVDPSLRPLPLSFLAPDPWTYDEQIPGGLHGVPTEDYWNDPVGPQGLAFQAPPPWSYEQHEAPPQIGFDEGVWVNPVAPVPLSFIAPPAWFYADDAVFPRVAPTEDFWNDPVAPTSLAFRFPAPWSYDEGLWVHPPAVGNAFDDVWVDPVRPLGLSFWAPAPWSYDIQQASPVLPTRGPFSADLCTCHFSTDPITAPQVALLTGAGSGDTTDVLALLGSLAPTDFLTGAAFVATSGTSVIRKTITSTGPTADGEIATLGSLTDRRLLVFALSPTENTSLLTAHTYTIQVMVTRDGVSWPKVVQRGTIQSILSITQRSGLVVLLATEDRNYLGTESRNYLGTE